MSCFSGNNRTRESSFANDDGTRVWRCLFQTPVASSTRVIISPARYHANDNLETIVNSAQLSDSSEKETSTSPKPQTSHLKWPSRLYSERIASTFTLSCPSSHHQVIPLTIRVPLDRNTHEENGLPGVLLAGFHIFLHLSLCLRFDDATLVTHTTYQASTWRP